MILGKGVASRFIWYIGDHYDLRAFPVGQAVRAVSPSFQNGGRGHCYWPLLERSWPDIADHVLQVEVLGASDPRGKGTRVWLDAISIEQ